jgi:hypothetical protein
MKRRNRFLIIATALAVLVAVAAWVPSAAAQGVDTAQLERLQRVIEQQQVQIKSQARMLEALQAQVNALARSSAQATETANQASRAASQAAVAARQASEQASQAQEPKRLVTSGKDSIKLSLSGQVNRGVLIADDGNNTHVFHVDNDNSSTRVRFIGTGNFNQDLSVGTQFEVQFESNSTAAINQFSSRGVGPNNFTERKLEFYVDSKRLGRVWVGQGSTASDGSSEVDLSGTGVIASSKVNDMAGGLIFSRAGAQPLAGDVTIGRAFSNLDGLSRDDRVRYDTPSFQGFKASASTIAGGRWDVAGRYSGELLDTKLAAAVAYWERTGSHGVSGSVSGRHKSGVNLTFAAGNRDFNAVGRNDSSFFYVKLGYLRKFFPKLGDTALAVDYFHGDDQSATGDDSQSYGAFIVQNFDRIATEFYIGGRVYDLDRPGARFQNIVAILSGARIKF